MFLRPSHEAVWETGTYESHDSVSVSYCKSVSASHLPKFVFLHGLLGAGPVLLPLLTDLTDRYQIFLPDARGHGHSGRIPTSSFTMENLVQDALNAIQHFASGQPVFLAGHSMGASTSARVAKLYPDYVTAVFLEEPPWLREEGHPVVPRNQKENSSGKSGGKGGSKGPGAGGGGFNPLAYAEKVQEMSEEEFQSAHREELNMQLPSHAYSMAQSLRLIQCDIIEPSFRATDDVINEAVTGIQVPSLLQVGLKGGHCQSDVAENTCATWRKGKISRWQNAGHVPHMDKGPWLKEVDDFFQSCLLIQ